MGQTLLVKKLSEHAIIPTRGSISAAGLDLYAAHPVVIPAKGKGLVKTDLSIALPQSTYGRIAPRSSLALKNHIDVGAGVIDMDYRGSVGVVLFNFSDVDFVVNRGDRFAQLIVEKICMPDLIVVVDICILDIFVDALVNTERGDGGFGSTGLSI